MQTTLISTVGTSLLTNNTEQEVRKLLTQTANATETALTGEQKTVIENRVAAVRAQLMQASSQTVAPFSAELNGAVAVAAQETIVSHYLLHTDTFQGRITAGLVAEWLRANYPGASVTPYCLEHLNTATQESFEKGMDSLLQWCDATIPALRESQQHIIFNLCGGFKSVQAFTQTLGMIYADEIVYIFEGAGASLIRIPRLPLQWQPPTDEQAALLARLVHGDTDETADTVRGLPEAYLSSLDENSFCISYWGKAAWLAMRRTIFADRLLPQPGLVYEPSFVADFKRNPNPQLRCDIQEALAKVSVVWREKGLASLRSDGGLLYETYANRGNIGHFRLNIGDRVSCVPDGDVLRIRHAGAHDYVNNNP